MLRALDKGKRLLIQDIPDRSTSSSYIQKKTSFITPPQKIESAKRCLRYEGDSGVCKAPRRELKRSVYSDPKDEIIKPISNENFNTESSAIRSAEKATREGELSKLTEEVATLKNEQTEYQRQLQMFQGEYERTRFTYEHVIKRGQCFYDWPY